MVLKPVFVIAIVAVAMIGVMIPTISADSPPPCMTESFYLKNFISKPSCTVGSKSIDTTADLSNANLSYRDLSGVNFSNANLSGADLSNADLSNANLFRAKLFQADLSNANLENANLKGASLPDKDPTPNIAVNCSRCVDDIDFVITIRNSDSSFNYLTDSHSKFIAMNPTIKSTSKFTTSSSGYSNYVPIEPSIPNWKPAVVPNYVPFEPSIPNWKPAVVPKFMEPQFSQTHVGKINPPPSYNYGRDVFLSEKYPSIGNIPSELRPWN